MKVKAKVAQSCPTLCDPMDYTVHGILQARILEWVAFPFSRGSSQPRDQTQVSHIAGRFFTSWATREALEYVYHIYIHSSVNGHLGCYHILAVASAAMNIGMHFSFWIVADIQLLSRVQLLVAPWIAAHQASLSFTISQSLPKLKSIESFNGLESFNGPSNHLFLYYPLLLLPSIFPSIRVFSNESALHIRWPKYCSFSFSISPSNEYLGLTGLISLQSKGLLRVFSNTTVQKYQFDARPFLWFNSHICTWLQENHSFDYTDFVSKVISKLLN